MGAPIVLGKLERLLLTMKNLLQLGDLLGNQIHYPLPLSTKLIGDALKDTFGTQDMLTLLTMNQGVLSV